MKKKLFSIAFVLEEFCSMLLSAKLFIYTDHINLIFATLNCHHIHCWHLFIDKYEPTSLYQHGKEDVCVDFLSYLQWWDVFPIPKGKNAPTVLWARISVMTLNSSNTFLNSHSLIPHLVDFNWIHEHHTLKMSLPLKQTNILVGTSMNTQMTNGVWCSSRLDSLTQWKMW